MHGMVGRRRRSLGVVAVAFAALGSGACTSGSGAPFEPGAERVTISADTVVGTASLAELQQRRSQWIARGIRDYRFQLQISCFCVVDVTRPVVVEVRNNAVAQVWDLRSGKPITAPARDYPTITKLFDDAIAMRSGNGHVSVAYDRALGYPARIEIGTIANDAGVLYLLGELRAL